MTNIITNILKTKKGTGFTYYLSCVMFDHLNFYAWRPHTQSTFKQGLVNYLSHFNLTHLLKLLKNKLPLLTLIPNAIGITNVTKTAYSPLPKLKFIARLGEFAVIENK